MNTVLRHHIGASLLLSFGAFACAVAFGVKVIPGGPFVSFRGDILPQVYAWAAVGLALARYDSHAIGHRLASLFSAGLALVVSILVGGSTYAFFHEPFARGDFFRW